VPIEKRLRRGTYSKRLEKENVDQVRALARSLGVTQSEIMNCLIELTGDIRNDIINRIADKLETRAEKLRRMTRKEG